MPINFHGPAKRLEDIDLPRIGAEIGVGEDEIHAVLEVESSGSGFDSQGRPKILFEPHVFYRNLHDVSRRTQAVAAGLAYAKWGEKPYPKDSYPRLIAAMAIDETAALKACSWGLPQVLGENFKACGFTSPQEMVRAFVESEANHLQAMVRFIKSAKLDDDLRRHDWAGFARGYNGPGYAKHNYHGRLAAAFARWQKIKDTPWTPGQLPPTPSTDQVRARAQQETKRHQEAEAARKLPVPEAATGTVIVVAGGEVARRAHETGASGSTVAAIVVIAALVAAGIFLAIRKWRRG